MRKFRVVYETKTYYSCIVYAEDKDIEDIADTIELDYMYMEETAKEVNIIEDVFVDEEYSIPHFMQCKDGYKQIQAI